MAYGNYAPPPTDMASGNWACPPTNTAPPDGSEDLFSLMRHVLRGCACAIIFLLLVLIDAWKVTKRRAYWFPGGVLVLSALTVQLINYLDYSDPIVGHNDTLDVELVFDSGRVAICVFIAYLLPGMVSSRFRNVWIDIGALALNVLVHMLSGWEESQSEWRSEFKVFSTILFASLILLVLLSVCTVFAGKSIHNIIDQKVPVVLSCCSNSPSKCNNIEEHVLKCWIVVRSCQPDYIIARSVFSSLAGLVVTLCVVSLIVKWRCTDRSNPELIKHFIPKDYYDYMYKPEFIMHFAFILAGWTVVSLRWLTAVIFFPRDAQCCIQMEDFWKRSMIEWKDDLDGHLKRRSFLEKRNRNIVDLMIALRLHYLLLAIGVCLQTLIVFLSRASWFISQTLFWPLVTRHKKNPPANFCKYKEVLEIIRMPGEIAYSLWIANESAFQQTEKNIQQGKARSSKELLKLVTIGSSADEAAETLMEEENKYFKYVGKRSSKMTAVSLIHFMLCLYDGSNFEMVDHSIEACSQAWDLMDFVHISDREANFVSRAADKEFWTLHDIWKQHLHMKPAESMAVRNIRNRLKQDIESRLSRINESQITVDNMHDSMNWMTAAVDISLSRTWEAIRRSNTVENMRCLLGNVIVNYLTKELKKAVVEKCREWAQNGMEEEIYHAAFIAGKTTRLLDEIGGGNNAVPKAVAEGKGNNGEAVADHGEDNNESRVEIRGGLTT